MDRNENFVLVYGIVIVLGLVVVLRFWVERALLRTLAQRATERAFHLGGRSPCLEFGHFLFTEGDA